MDLNDKELLYKIMSTRDKRYDGRFYCGVHTTGIYCRPICPAKPKIQNVSFYRSSAEAELAGFRPCLRCRPELAPTTAQWNGTAAVVGRALTMISRGDADDLSLSQLSNKLGVSDRHLRRLFEEHVGASPLDVAISKRLHLAKQLIVNSSLPITEIAFASGYQSIRRFNEAFKEKFKSAPRSLRQPGRSDSGVKSDSIHVEIPIIEPFDWPHIYGFLKNHSVLGVESFSEQKYRRSFSVGSSHGALEIGFDPKKSQINATISIDDPSHLREVMERVRDLFDTRSNPHSRLTQLQDADPIAKLYRNELGIRIPGAWDPFETAICIVLGQLVSVEHAKALVKRLVEKFGTPISIPQFNECTFLFPSPKVLSNASLKEIGITKVRENAIVELSRQVHEGKIELSRSADIAKTREQLLSIKGIGPWTTEMIAMRCLGDVNAFPKTDLIIKRALEKYQKEKGDWSPWNSYVTLSIWKKYAAALSKKSQKTKAIEP